MDYIFYFIYICGIQSEHNILNLGANLVPIAVFDTCCLTFPLNSK